MRRRSRWKTSTRTSRAARPLARAALDGTLRDGAAAFARDAVHSRGVHPGVLHGRRGAGALRADGAGGRLRDGRVVHPVEHAGADPQRVVSPRTRRRQSTMRPSVGRLQSRLRGRAPRRGRGALAAGADLSGRCGCGGLDHRRPARHGDFPEDGHRAVCAALPRAERHAGRHDGEQSRSRSSPSSPARPAARTRSR